MSEKRWTYEETVAATDALEEITVDAHLASQKGWYLGDNVGSDGKVYGIIEYKDKTRKKIRL